MMIEGGDSVQVRLDALKREFVEQLPQRIAELDKAYAAWCDNDDLDQLGELHRLTHSLTGAGATFGHDQISKVARNLEMFLKRIKDNDSKINNNYFDQANNLLDIIKAEVAKICNTVDESLCSKRWPGNVQR